MDQKRILIDGSQGLGLKIGKREIGQFDTYTRELLEWSRRLNLTGHRDRESIEIYHYLDSLSLFQTGLIGPDQSILDVGSGAGFPGLPLKILEPSLDLTLLEASERRGAFLRYLVRLFEMEKVQVEVARAEVFGRRGEPSFQRIISRALGGMAKICSWTAGLLAPEGLFVFQKSRRVGKEISDIHDSLKKLRLEVRDVKTLSVPHLDRHRYAVIIGKIKK